MKFAGVCAFLLLWIVSCSAHSPESHLPSYADSLPLKGDELLEETAIKEEKVLPGIYAINDIVASLEGKKVAVIANQTSLIEQTHLVDTLLARNVEVVKVFASEHGFRGDAPDGETIDDSKDAKTGLPIVSLYGKTKKPTPQMLADVDVIVYDIQDVGTRFYTFISTMHYAMEAAAENNLEMLVIDRPNPNGFYVDGPVLDLKFRSFVGMHPIPAVYGMTPGEVAFMINGEGWLKDGVKCDLKVIPCQNYTRASLYQLPVIPSPNLPSMEAIYWYPSLCFLEGTSVSVGRGTPTPFTVIGEPGNTGGDYKFTPISIKNASLHPPHENKECRGYNLTGKMDVANPVDSLQLSWLLRMYNETRNKESFFRKDGYFDLLAGTDKLRKALVEGKTEAEIRQEWQRDLELFKEMRKKYLIYPEE